MRRALALTLLLIALVAGGVPVGVGAALARDADEAAVERATYKVFRLQLKGLFDVLYDRLHPDARAVVAEDVVVGWHRIEFANKRTNDLIIDDIDFGEWTWEVTGETYADAAAVAYTHVYWTDGATVEEEGVLRLVKHGKEWGWFFGETKEFLDEQTARFTDIDPLTVSPFANQLDADIDLFWARAFDAAGRDYPRPEGIVGFDGPIATDCGTAYPGDAPAFYCPFDETIYYEIGFRDEITADMGDFSWVSIVAHEWGHHVQDTLKLRALQRSAKTGALTVKESELQADCLAGAYSQDAEIRGWLDPGDLDEANSLFEYAGDPPGTSADDMGAHGNGKERRRAFTKGYGGGIAACDLEL